jgi:hypothetical protein
MVRNESEEKEAGSNQQNQADEFVQAPVAGRREYQFEWLHRGILRCLPHACGCRSGRPILNARASSLSQRRELAAENRHRAASPGNRVRDSQMLLCSGRRAQAAKQNLIQHINKQKQFSHPQEFLQVSGPRPGSGCSLEDANCRS